MDEDFYKFYYNMEIVFYDHIPFDFTLKGLNLIVPPKYKNTFFLIKNEINLINNHFYRGISALDSLDYLFHKDTSFMKNGIFDNSYDILIEFSYLDNNTILYNEIGSHHLNCYRGNVNIENIHIHNIFINVYSQYDMVEIIKKMMENQIIKKQKPSVVGIIYDLTNIKYLYQCYEFNFI
jgi:hypothetical protein